MSKMTKLKSMQPPGHWLRRRWRPQSQPFRASHRPRTSVQEGGFVVLESGDWQFYGLVIDLQLGALIRVMRRNPRRTSFRRSQPLLARADAVYQPGSSSAP